MTEGEKEKERGRGVQKLSALAIAWLAEAAKRGRHGSEGETPQPLSLHAVSPGQSNQDEVRK